MYLKAWATVYEVEANQLVPLLTPLFFGWTISLTLLFLQPSLFKTVHLRHVCLFWALNIGNAFNKKKEKSLTSSKSSVSNCVFAI